jgi:RNA polymerase sigma-70 factor (ECF subfamily)
MAVSERSSGFPDDSAIIRGLRSEDSRSLQGLLDVYWVPLVGFAQRILAGRGAPEDAVQDAFVRLWAKRDSLREDGSVRALLYAIVRNVCLDELRRNAREDRAAEAAPQPASPRTPYEDVHGAEMQRVAAAAVSRLPERRREVFRLVREEGLSYQEVAEVMGLAPQTVANHMSLAMADLRTSLRPYLARGESGTTGEALRDRETNDG